MDETIGECTQFPPNRYGKRITFLGPDFAASASAFFSNFSLRRNATLRAKISSGFSGGSRLKVPSGLIFSTRSTGKGSSSSFNRFPFLIESSSPSAGRLPASAWEAPFSVEYAISVSPSGGACVAPGIPASAAIPSCVHSPPGRARNGGRITQPTVFATA
eukprot:1986505-Rhodomonas_salina.3